MTTATIARTAFHIPVFGWLLKDAVHGKDDAKYYFVANIFITLAALVYVFGYPLLIILALTATASALVMLVVLTATDLVDQYARRRKARAAAKAAVTPQ